MKIEVHKLPSEGISLEVEREARNFAALHALMAAGEAEFPSPIQIELNIRPEADIVKVDGRVVLRLRVPCSRCLATIESLVDQAFTLRFSNRIPHDLHAGEPTDLELTAEQIGLEYYEGDSIDFSDAVQEQIVLALPVKPICRKDCKGLCPRCGADRNHEVCLCGNQKPVGPFDVLKNLKFS